MSPEVQAHIFEPFFTTKAVGQGTGLGLATVYGIVKQSEGHIVVHSAPGRGTSFELYFPRSLEAAATESPPAAPARSSRGTETVLVVEDDPQVREVTTRALRDGGYRVLAFRGGPEALAIAPGELAQTKLVVCDVILPGLDGPAVARELRGRSPGLRVLYVSGYTHDGMAERGVLDPPLAFLQKPFTASSLLVRVREALDAAGASA